MNRNKMVAAALGLVVGAGAIGWVAGTQITSPAEAAANAKPPTPSLITTAVEKRLLSADIIARGTIDFSDPVSLAVNGSIGEAGATAVVTMIPEVGTELKEGGVALEVSGRPVLLLQGELPVYRDLRPGSKGDDVLQLEQALERLGLMTGADDTWSDATGAAVQGLYATAGYTANATSKTDQAALDGARDSVRLANQSLQDALKALSEAGGASGSSLLEAKAAVDTAQGELTAATTQRTAEIALVNSEVAKADAKLTNSQKQLVARQAELQALIDAATPKTDLEYIEAEAAVAAAQLEVTTDQAALTDAGNRVGVVTTQQDNAVSSAQRTLDIAKARLSEAQSPGDTTFLVRARDEAQRQLADATTQLTELEKSVGTWIPSGELIFVKLLPVQVAEVQATRGGSATGSFMTVSGADVAMTVGVQKADAARLEVGDKVIIDEPDLLPEPIEATISEIPDAENAERVQMKVLLDSIPPELMGASVRVIIPVESTSGEVLVVPAAALSAVANGDVRLEVEDAAKPGTTRFVTVVTGLAADGVVEVKPVEGSLAKGDRVVVGKADIGPAGADDESGEDPSEDPSEDPGEEPSEDEPEPSAASDEG